MHVVKNALPTCHNRRNHSKCRSKRISRFNHTCPSPFIAFTSICTLCKLLHLLQSFASFANFCIFCKVLQVLQLESLSRKNSNVYRKIGGRRHDATALLAVVRSTSIMHSTAITHSWQTSIPQPPRSPSQVRAPWTRSRFLRWLPTAPLPRTPRPPFHVTIRRSPRNPSRACHLCGGNPHHA